MSTATDSRVAELREQVADAEREMGANYGDQAAFARAIAKRGEAMRELRQMGEAR